jgi:hypothetical protein
LLGKLLTRKTNATIQILFKEVLPESPLIWYGLPGFLNLKMKRDNFEVVSRIYYVRLYGPITWNHQNIKNEILQ